MTYPCFDDLNRRVVLNQKRNPSVPKQFYVPPYAALIEPQPAPQPVDSECVRASIHLQRKHVSEKSQAVVYRRVEPLYVGVENIGDSGSESIRRPSKGAEGPAPLNVVHSIDGNGDKEHGRKT